MFAPTRRLPDAKKIVKLFRKIKLFCETTVSAFYFIFLQQVEIKDFLKIEGEIIDRKIEIDEDRQVVKVSADAKMQAVNNANGLVELINPKFFKQSKSKYFATTKEDCSRISRLYSAIYSNDILPNYDLEKLEFDLKEGRCPGDIFIKLEKSEKYFWEEKIYFEFDLMTGKGRWQGVTWNEMLEKADAFWFQYDYRLPEKFQSLKPKLFEFFDENWKVAGEIPAARFLGMEIKSALLTVDTRPLFIKFAE